MLRWLPEDNIAGAPLLAGGARSAGRSGGERPTGRAAEPASEALGRGNDKADKMRSNGTEHEAPRPTRRRSGDGDAYLLELREVSAPDPGDEQMAMLERALSQQAAQGRAGDALQLYIRALMAREGISFDQPALNAVHSQVFN